MKKADYFKRTCWYVIYVILFVIYGIVLWKAGMTIRNVNFYGVVIITLAIVIWGHVMDLFDIS